MAVEEEEQKCPDCPACLPAYLATFADLMSLLMCFFVLLLSFAELDVKKFKQLAGSMRSAFGVQAQIKADSMPKGTSIIALEFSPGAPRQTITNEVRQETTDETKNDLDFSEGQDSGDRRSSEDDEKQKSEVPEIIDDAEAEKAKAQEEAEVEEELEEIQEQLKEEIAEDMLEVENDNGKIVIRIKEKGSFPSGRAELMPGFKEVMTKLQQVVKESGKDVIVAGHTDNRSIRTRRFRSNWDLSSARAVTVLNALLKEKGIESTKVMVQGRADTVPLYPNDTKEHRSKNRRVEIILVKGSDKEKVTTLEDLDKGHAEDAAEAQKADWDNDWEEGDDSETEIDEVDAVDPDSDTEFGAEDTGEEKTEEA
ncbi:MAG: OmpA family protein, partial [Methylococcales bacterium]|nr:OmpA family protein [Methylococcales bacterium]